MFLNWAWFITPWCILNFLRQCVANFACNLCNWLYKIGIDCENYGYERQKVSAFITMIHGG